MINSLFNKRNILYSLFAVFLLFIFIRWGALVHQKNTTAYKDKIALYDLIIDIDTSETTLELYDQEVAYLNEQYQKQRYRIALEGIIFLILLLVGITRMFIYFRKEIDLALQQSNFLLSITHELKSPLSSALLNIQTILKRDTLQVSKQEKLLHNSEEELVRLRTLVERLLLAAKMENEEIVYDMIRFNYSELVTQLFENYKIQYGQQFDLKSEVDSEIYIEGDRVLIRSVMANLMDNAVKYCSVNGGITVKLYAKEDKAILEVANDGQQLSDKEKELIFTKFYRIGDENTRSSKGTGLGLYIVNEIIEGHQGKIKVSHNGQQIVFSILLETHNSV